jgi:hypothetical protein
VTILSRRTFFFLKKKKEKDILGKKITLDFEEGKGTRDAIGMKRVISEGNLDIDEEFCACFIVWQKALDGIN